MSHGLLVAVLTFLHFLVSGVWASDLDWAKMEPGEVMCYWKGESCKCDGRVQAGQSVIAVSGSSEKWCLAAEQGAGAMGYLSPPQTSCVAPNWEHWKRPYGDVPNSFAGFLECGAKCKQGNYTYFGLECPRAEQIHCQCSNTIAGSFWKTDEECDGSNLPAVKKLYSSPTYSSPQCVGPFKTNEGYMLGATARSSVYLTEAVRIRLKPERRLRQIPGVIIPHLTNIKGQDFDIMQEGQMLMLEMPRQSSAQNLNLSVRADVDRVHSGADGCGPAHITNIYMDGAWLGRPIHFQAGKVAQVPFEKDDNAFGIQFADDHTLSAASFRVKYKEGLQLTNAADVSLTKWGRAFILKVQDLEIVVKQPIHSRVFLEIQVKGLENLSGDVGGLLGVDDHSEVKKLPAECKLNFT